MKKLCSIIIMFILSDYLLTAITFISNQNISDLSFSFLYSHLGFPLNDIKIRYE